MEYILIGLLVIIIIGMAGLLFVINATTGIPLRVIIRDIWPWVGVLVACLATMIAFPEIVLVVPKMFGYVPGTI